MSKIAEGTQVSVHYTGKLADGTVFDSSEGREPLTFTIGQKQVIPGFEEAVAEMEVGEKKTITIPCEQAYGPKREDMIIDIPLETVPEDIPREVGQQILLRSPEGQEFPAFIVEVKEDALTIDANHPLAGEDLVFEIELVSA
ncbi:peptidylprolyl isomerase [Desulfonauticus submarinus]|uniref:Peptidyl-prolyl cis-trans isomerase n=1 Tax=Desulfonauticus submarinus TaxID=206665 RepID=A0A1H0BW80_9BACT|nr:peptidylprolyl isomerase [Desulfonauticus submarinus]SDN49931.1 peptidylprolyl isomerase [Desulfonauticus submarinus]